MVGVRLTVDHELLGAAALDLAELTLNCLGRSIPEWDGLHLVVPVVCGVALGEATSDLPLRESLLLELYHRWVADLPPALVPTLVVAVGEEELHLGD